MREGGRKRESERKVGGRVIGRYNRKEIAR